MIEEIASNPAKKGTVEQKIADLYNLALDSVKLNTEGFQPVSSQLNAIASISSVDELSKLIPELSMSGIDAYFTTYVGSDAKNSEKYLLQTYQSGISLGEREYYLDTDEKTLNILIK